MSAAPGFLPEMLAWDALRQLMNLFDKAVEVILSVSQINLLQLNIILVVTYFAFTFFFMHCLKSAEERHTQWTLDPDYFEKKTVHDDEKDHRSQHFRRYGHGASLMTSVIQFHFMQHLLTFLHQISSFQLFWCN